VREPTNHHSQYIFSDSIHLCEALIPLIKKSKSEPDWLKQWKVMDETIINILKQTDDVLTEGETVRIVSEDIKSNQAFFTGNSMSVRDLDSFLFPSEKTFNTVGNRGASSIDGITSSAICVAAVTGEQVTLIIGDLSFYHDLNGLLAAK